MDFSPRQIEIIQAATRLIGEKGIQNVTTKHLAEEMGFSEPALYRHFSGKTEILISVLEYFRQKMSAGLRPMLTGDIPAIEKIHRLIRFQFELFASNPAVIMVIFAETSFQYDKKLSETVGRLLLQKQQLVKKILSEGQKKGTIRQDVEAEQLTSIILGGMRFTVLQWRLSGFSFDLPARGEKLYQTLKALTSPEN